MVTLIPGQRVHFIGIGGFGLSAIARVMLLQGFTVSGSDRGRNAFTEALARAGATIHQGHDAVYVQGAELVIRSSAVPDNHIEVLSAQAQGIPIYKRSDIIAPLMTGHMGIGIAGTHGKTTTTAMTIHILSQTGQQPTYIVGGVMRNTGLNADVGSGRAFVIEADEYDNMFHGLRLNVAVVTNVEWDHPDFFHSEQTLVTAFKHFVGLLPDTGWLIACMEDPIASIFANNRIVVGLPTTTYGIEHAQAHWRARNIRYEAEGTRFEVWRRGEPLGAVNMPLPGRHNVLNALAALIVADHEGVRFADAAAALASFQGTGRRFEVRGERDGVLIVDDYAHHPTAIRATLQAARQRYPDRALWAVWQPHTYSRTQELLGGFVTAFANADHVLVTDIYAAREKATFGFTAETVVWAMEHPDVRYTGDLDATLAVLRQHVKAPAVVLIMSAGDAPQIGVDYLAPASENETNEPSETNEKQDEAPS